MILSPYRLRTLLLIFVTDQWDNIDGKHSHNDALSIDTYTRHALLGIRTLLIAIIKPQH